MRWMIATIVFLVIIGTMLAFILDDISRLARSKEVSALKWQLITVITFLLGGTLVAGLTAALFLLLEVGLIWVYVPVIPSCWIIFLIIKRRLRTST